jgi:hypothetical protein
MTYVNRMTTMTFRKRAKVGSRGSFIRTPPRGARIQLKTRRRRDDNHEEHVFEITYIHSTPLPTEGFEYTNTFCADCTTVPMYVDVCVSIQGFDGPRLRVRYLSALIHSYIKHSTAQHNTTQHSTAQHSTLQHRDETRCGALRKRFKYGFSR